MLGMREVVALPGGRLPEIRVMALRALLAMVLAATGCGTSHRDQVPAAKDDAANAGNSASTGSRNQNSWGNEPLPVLAELPEFQLTASTGYPVGSNELRDVVWIANFIFTRCTATCPMQTERLAEFQRLAGRWPDHDRLRIVSFSVDPEYDTPERLADYSRRHGADPERWHFLTGSRRALWQLSKTGFLLPVSENAKDAASPIAHSPNFVLVDSRLRIRGYYNSTEGSAIRKLQRDVWKLLEEDAPGPLNVAVPGDLFDSAWLDQRREEQLKAADALEVFHDFRFEDRQPESGISFVHRITADSGRNFRLNHYDHGNGIAAADVDGDALTDLYFLSQSGGNALFRNLGNGRFENITDRAGVALAGRVSSTASFADTDNDGDPDLYVTTIRHGNAFFENDGTGQFRDVTTEAGLAYTGHSSSSEFFDYDNDGRLDLFLVNIGRFTTDEVGYNGPPGTEELPYYIGMKDAFGAHLVPERLERSILYHNEGGNRFRDASTETGLVHSIWSGDATPLDVNDDGWQDLYVLGMQGYDEYYQNDGTGKFKRLDREAFPGACWGAMGVKSFDFNNDGRMDLYLTNMHADMWVQKGSNVDEKERPKRATVPSVFLNARDRVTGIYGNAFFLNRGGRFDEVGDRINAENYWPWGLSTGDLNADGFQDAFVTASMNLTFRYHPNSLLLNDRGRKFIDSEFLVGVEPRRGEQIAAPWYELDCAGRDAELPECDGRTGPAVAWGALGSRSSVILDLDGDGDLDIVTNDFNSAPMVLISDLSARNPDLRFLKVQLRGTRGNRDGLGARVQVRAGDLELTQVHDGQSGYLSQSSLPLYFGLGSAPSIERISIRWPGGASQVLEGPIEPNQLIVLTEPGEEPLKAAPESP